MEVNRKRESESVMQCSLQNFRDMAGDIENIELGLFSSEMRTCNEHLLPLIQLYQ